MTRNLVNVFAAACALLGLALFLDSAATQGGLAEGPPPPCDYTTPSVSTVKCYTPQPGSGQIFCEQQNNVDACDLYSRFFGAQTGAIEYVNNNGDVPASCNSTPKNLGNCSEISVACYQDVYCFYGSAQQGQGGSCYVDPTYTSGVIYPATKRTSKTCTVTAPPG